MQGDLRLRGNSVVPLSIQDHGENSTHKSTYSRTKLSNFSPIGPFEKVASRERSEQDVTLSRQVSQHSSGSKQGHLKKRKPIGIQFQNDLEYGGGSSSKKPLRLVKILKSHIGDPEILETVNDDTSYNQTSNMATNNQ